jgi:hypothetical protein
MSINYNKLDKLIEKIPKNFYCEFLGRLVSCFGPNITEDFSNEMLTSEALENGECCYGYEMEEGTCGWFEAFRMTTINLNLEDIFIEYKNLNWMESDIFDGMISEQIKKLNREDFINYYKYIVKRT